jgi:signal peptidase
VGRTIRSSRLVTTALVTTAVLMLSIGVVFRIADLHIQTVLSGSMRPTVSPGDMAVTQAVSISSLRVGDAIVFFPPGQSVPVLHRITSLKATPAGLQITTRGDANRVDDPWHVTLHGTTAYRLVGVVPFVGWLSELQRPALLLAGLLLGLGILLEIRKEVKAWRTKSFSPPLS